MKLLQYFSQRVLSILYNKRKNVRQDILANACLTQKCASELRIIEY